MTRHLPALPDFFLTDSLFLPLLRQVTLQELCGLELRREGQDFSHNNVFDA